MMQAEEEIEALTSSTTLNSSKKRKASPAPATNNNHKKTVHQMSEPARGSSASRPDPPLGSTFPERMEICRQM